MKPGSIFWVVDYIKSHRNKETRYAIDLYLLRQGYDAGTIEDAWQIAGLRLESKTLPYYNWLFPVEIICNILSWYCVSMSWQWAITPTLLFLSLAVWSFINVAIFFSPTPTLNSFKIALVFNFICISLALAFDLITIIMAFGKLDWQGPVGLTLALSIALTCSLLELSYIPNRIEVVLSAKSPK